MIDEPDYDLGCCDEDFCYGCRTAGCSGECRTWAAQRELDLSIDEARLEEAS